MDQAAQSRRGTACPATARFQTRVTRTALSLQDLLPVLVGQADLL
jgi:hypothetical protein